YNLAGWKALSGKDAHSVQGSTGYAQTLRLYVNDTSAPVTITAPSGTFYDLDGNLIGSSFELGAMSSRVVSLAP
ncbi:MAG: hypothetical protein HY835_06995, partial [Anaerolineae bacterium]|nr:hypothetical protein [Anaerolineae bacterium]